ncbi:hypothetical protein LR032_05060 [Candidatus Bipolaricaulota bacterium]|nr:hypothetical protein [Candidatus Bipolaricaulota bacterium]
MNLNAVRPSQDIDLAAAMHAIGIVSGSLVLALVGIVILVTRLPHTRFRFGGVILSQAITGRVFDRVKGKVVEEIPWIDRQGVAATVLRPVGSGEFAGERTDVVCEEEFLSEGTPVVVIKDEGYRKVVQKIEKDTARIAGVKKELICFHISSRYKAKVREILKASGHYDGLDFKVTLVPPGRIFVID